MGRSGCSLPANASGCDPHRASISSRFGQAGSLLAALLSVVAFAAALAKADSPEITAPPPTWLYACLVASCIACGLSFASFQPAALVRAFSPPSLPLHHSREHVAAISPSASARGACSHCGYTRSMLTDIYLCHPCSVTKFRVTRVGGRLLFGRSSPRSALTPVRGARRRLCWRCMHDNVVGVGGPQLPSIRAPPYADSEIVAAPLWAASEVVSCSICYFYCQIFGIALVKAATVLQSADGGMTHVNVCFCGVQAAATVAQVCTVPSPPSGGTGALCPSAECAAHAQRVWLELTRRRGPAVHAEDEWPHWVEALTDTTPAPGSLCRLLTMLCALAAQAAFFRGQLRRSEALAAQPSPLTLSPKQPFVGAGGAAWGPGEQGGASGTFPPGGGAAPGQRPYGTGWTPPVTRLTRVSTDTSTLGAASSR
jgi:hypothetical protein